jgi:hypothetical protein
MNPPDLQQLVAEFGGYNKITPDAWAQHDKVMDAYQTAIREPPQSTHSDKALDALPTLGPIERHWGYQRCLDCGGEAHFGYLSADGEMQWTCAQHRLAKYWADARR